MKIEIDLNDLLTDEDGYSQETLQESVRRQVVEHFSKSIKEGVQKRVNEETQRILNEELQTALKDRMPALIEDVFTAEFIPVTNYGQRGEPTTFRAELIKAIHTQMVYKRANYDSDKNAFSRAVDDCLAENMKQFKADFNKLAKDNFERDALAYAVGEMRKRLGIAA